MVVAVPGPERGLIDQVAGFFEEGLVDRFIVFVGSMIIGGRESPTPVDGAGFPMSGLKKLALKKATKTKSGIILEYDAV